ncbi:sensor histidine kinase [Microbacterium mangrovi]|uniref:sensor histidine kinase n=1 Tax=Microbacterium mangrovi TaxID=1348253 RepID=UPI00068E18AC|nr:sensor histidine kinase [Microbacterium mangrovi]
MTDDVRRGFHPPTAVVVVVPVVVSFFVQVPGTVWVGLASQTPAPWVILRTAVAAAAALVLLAARRAPGLTVVLTAALAAAYLLMPPSYGPPVIALAFAIIGAVVRQQMWWAVVSVTVGWTLVVSVAATAGTHWHPAVAIAATVALALCFAIGAGIRTRIQRASQYRARLDERRRAAEQEERARIARELHDVLAHSLSQISVQSGMGLHLFDREPERAREALANIRGLAATGLDEVRGVLSFLRGDDAAPLTPAPGLGDIAELTARRSGLGLEITLDDRLHGAAPDSAVQTTAYRIVQEALTNVVRHSAASTAHVLLDRDGDALVVSVTDDGTGAADSREGAGIRGMRERASLVGGSLTVQAAHPRGTAVRASLPWRQEGSS